MKNLIKIFLIINMLLITASAIELNSQWIKENYFYIKTQKDQMKILRKSYDIGEALIIGKESYGKTLAAFALVESSLGRDRIGDNGNTFGLTHFSIARAREIIPVSSYLSGLDALSDKELSYILQTRDDINLILCGLNFKMNLSRYESYSKAVRAHNGYIPGHFSNLDYYERFANALAIINRMKKNNLLN